MLHHKIEGRRRGYFWFKHSVGMQIFSRIPHVCLCTFRQMAVCLHFSNVLLVLRAIAPTDFWSQNNIPKLKKILENVDSSLSSFSFLLHILLLYFNPAGTLTSSALLPHWFISSAFPSIQRFWEFATFFYLSYCWLEVPICQEGLVSSGLHIGSVGFPLPSRVEIAQSVERWPPGWKAWVWFRTVYDFSVLHSVQTGSEAHATSYLMGTGGDFPGGGEADHSTSI
jgi:hypothetical protein